MRRELIVAIDGPSGAGKSTLSRLLAQRLGYTHIDTGAMYRAVALAAYRQGVALDDTAGLETLCDRIRIDFRRESEGLRVLLDGEDVTEAIRTPENSLRTSRVSACPAVREAMVAQQRRLGEAGGVVLEGRDIGSVVFPRAEVKFFLTASAEERGRRRWLELTEKGVPVALQRTIEEVEERDRADSGRAHSPLMQPQDAVAVDSTGISIDQVLDRMATLVRQRRLAAGLPEKDEA